VHGGGGHSGGGGGSHGVGPQPAHANRQVVRSSTYTPPSALKRAPFARQTAVSSQRVPNASGGRPQTLTRRGNYTPSRIGQGSRPSFDHTSRAPGNRQFTKTAEGRQYDNGIFLHAGIYATTSWQHHYFPGGSYHYPYYAGSFGRGDYISPFGFYFGICDPWILSTDCSVYPPADAYINIPIYSGSVFSGWADTDDNAFDQPSLNAMEPGLLNATDEISEASQNGNIDAMVSLVDPNVSIAIYTQGKYQYSMNANDYLDLTRDTIKSVKTVSLSLGYLRQDSPTIYTLSGKQVYVGLNGQNRTVYLSFVLQDISGQWTLTQVETSPDRIQNFG
jgi:hypothetical protein